jgi:Immunity protein Imm1
MSATYVDLQDSANPYSGREIDNVGEFRDLLRVERKRPPFFAKLIGDSGANLQLGIGPDYACVQFGEESGDPPYLVAVEVPVTRTGILSFLIADTATEVPGRFGITHDVLEHIVDYFLRTGQIDPEAEWEEI